MIQSGLKSETLCVSASHPALSGHFPGNPLVPGVVFLAGVIAGMVSVLLLPGSVIAGTAPPPVRVETVVGGLEIPWEVDFAPDGRVFITERPGRVRIVDLTQTLSPEFPQISLPPIIGEHGNVTTTAFKRSRDEDFSKWARRSG